MTTITPADRIRGCLLTQEGDRARVPWDEFGDGEPSGWLVTNKVLWARRAPGTTCLGALQSGEVGTPQRRLNNSKGCGGVMRVAPIGLVASDPYQLAVEAAAITHSHPSGYLAAGAFAEIIGLVARGEEFPDAALAAQQRAASEAGGDETATAIAAAMASARAVPVPTPEAVEDLGAGWVAEEALAIALYCALTARDFGHGVLAAVNHSGDSDSTGSICGNLLGARWGLAAVPEGWLNGLAERTIVREVADDLVNNFVEGGPPGFDRYPPW